MNISRFKLLCVVSLILVAVPAFATTITFDDLSNGEFIFNYDGLNWNNFVVLDGVNAPPSGYKNGVISPNNVAFNGGGLPAVISSNTSFTLTSGYFTAAWNDNLQLQVIGSLADNTLYDMTFTLSATSPTLLNLNYLGIDTVQFISSGGNNHGYGGEGIQFALDNLVINERSGIGVPDSGSTALLLSLCFGGVCFLRRKQS